jgi:hypothetical protein
VAVGQCRVEGVVTRRRIGFVLSTLIALLLVAVTLRPDPTIEEGLPFSCLLCAEGAGTDVVRNIILFLPFGLALGFAGVRVRSALILAFGLSLAIEIAQFKLVVGRDASPADLLSNAFGGLIGGAIGAHLRLLLWPDRREAVRLALGWGAVWTAVLMTTAWALRPFLPDDVPWTSQATLTSKNRYAGTVLSARVGNHVLAPDTFLTIPLMDAALRSGAPVSVVVLTPTPPEEQAHLIQIGDSWTREMAALLQHGTSAEFTMRLNASRIRFLTPGVRLRHVFPDRAGDTVAVWGALREGTLHIGTGSDGSGNSASSLVLSPNLGWTLIWMPHEALGGEAAWLTALWIAGFAIPLGYWVGKARAGGSRAHLAVAVAMPTAAFFILPVTFEVGRVQPLELLAFGVALVLGWSAAWGSERVTSRSAHILTEEHPSPSPSRTPA